MTARGMVLTREAGVSIKPGLGAKRNSRNVSLKVFKTREAGDSRISIGIISEEIKSVSCVSDPVATAPGSDFYRPLRGLDCNWWL